MKIHFWGARGSIPVSLNSEQVRAKIIRALRAARGRHLETDEEIGKFVDERLPFVTRGTYGGNTSCVEVMGGREIILCDAGSGLKDFGQSILSGDKEEIGTINIFISHLHWDHMQGFPFFRPAYLPGYRINIFGCHRDLKEAFSNQQAPMNFPVSLKEMKAEIRFNVMREGREYDIGGVKVTPKRQQHPGDSYGYRFTSGGRSVVYSTDAEHSSDLNPIEQEYVEFIRDADLVIYDAQYCYAEATVFKEHWGHSSNIVGVEQAAKAGVRQLVLFHSDPLKSDEMLDKILSDTREYLKIYDKESQMVIQLAYDGLEIDL